MNITTRLLLCLTLLTATFTASAQTLEGKLRDQLRSTTDKLREAQAQLPQLQAEKLAAETERDALRKQLAAAKAQVSGLRGKVETELKSEQEARATAEQAVGQLRPALEEASTLAKNKEAERAWLQAELGKSGGALKVCTEQNAKLYQTGQELVSAYQNIGVGEVLAAREPFLGLKRVELENAAQGFGDRLYEGQYLPAAPVVVP